MSLKLPFPKTPQRLADEAYTNLMASTSESELVSNLDLFAMAHDRHPVKIEVEKLQAIVDKLKALGHKGFDEGFIADKKIASIEDMAAQLAAGKPNFLPSHVAEYVFANAISSYSKGDSLKPNMAGYYADLYRDRVNFDTQKKIPAPGPGAKS